jgi:hypothetical protein
MHLDTQTVKHSLLNTPHSSAPRFRLIVVSQEVQNAMDDQ